MNINRRLGLGRFSRSVDEMLLSLKLAYMRIVYLVHYNSGGDPISCYTDLCGGSVTVTTITVSL